MIPPATPDHWEPPAHERIWYHHAMTGDRGYAVRRGGKDGIRYDRPAVDEVSFNLGDWKRLAEVRDVFSPSQVAQVCFEADRKLCWALGQPELAKREWADMTEKARVKWVTDGPPAAALKRVKLYMAIREALK